MRKPCSQRFIRLAGSLFALLWLAVPADAQLVWNAAQPMAAARSNFSMTVLTDGRVLVAGGSRAGSTLRDCEIFDPATRTWSSTGQLGTARYDHAAARLQDGRVLVVGGYDASGFSTTSAEVFNPSTNTWSLVAGLPRTDYAISAVALLNGNVLVLDGANTTGEVFDPLANTWTDTPSFEYPRDLHTATLLSDGRVLIAGGYDYSEAPEPTTGLLYNPTTNTWTETGAHVVPRRAHSATLLTGDRVLIVGGLSNATDSILAEAEIYDPVSNTWSSTGGDLTTARVLHSAMLSQDGTVLVVGGCETSDCTSVIAQSEAFDPNTGLFALASSLGQARCDHESVTLLDGRPMVAGGYDYSDPFSSVELYEPPIDDSEFPSVALTAPSPGAFLSGTVLLTADASDDTGVVSVTFYDGAITLCVDGTSPYECAWDTIEVERGAHVLKAQARDRANTTTDSETVSVTVQDPPSSATLSLTAASVLGGGGTVTATGLTCTAPATCESTHAVGSTVTLSYTSDSGSVFSGWSGACSGGLPTCTIPMDQARSVTAYFTGTDTTPPTVTITEPTLTGTLASDPFVIRASASDNGIVLQVEFYVDGASVGADTTSPYEVRVSATRFTPGPHQLTAMAWDGRYQTTISAPVGIVVPEGGGYLYATYDSALGAPVCALQVHSCESGTTLGGSPEPNAPNTIDSCTDGATGSPERVDALRIRTQDGGLVNGERLAPGQQVVVDAWLSYSASEADAFDLYYAPDATNPVWQLVYSTTTLGSNIENIPLTLTAAGEFQAIRGVVRRGSVPNGTACFGSGYDDHDDLVFRVAPETRYQPDWKAPGCLGFGAACSSEKLLEGRASLGPETNATNTSSCPDDNTGVSSRSIEKIRVVSTDGEPLARHHSATIEVTIFASANWQNERLDVYAGSLSLVWSLIGSVTPPGPGLRTLTLPLTFEDAPITRAIRAAYRNKTVPATDSCTAGVEGDLDDLWYRTDSSVPAIHALVIDAYGGGTGFGSVLVSASTGGSLTPCAAQVDVINRCEYERSQTDTVTLTPSAGSGTRFAGFEGACTGLGECTLSMDQARQVTARFAPDSPMLTLVATGQNGAMGWISAQTVPYDPDGYFECNYPQNPSCEHSYALGTVVQLDATPEGDSVFAGWGGACEGFGVEPVCTITIDQAKAVTADFDGPRTLSLVAAGLNGAQGTIGAMTVPDDPNGRVSCDYPTSPTCEHAYKLGTVVQIDAAPGTNSVFTGWTGDCASFGTTPNCTLTINGNKTVTANFDGPRTLSLVAAGQNGATGTIGAAPVPDDPNGRVSCDYPTSPTCEHAYKLGTVVQIDAAPGTNSAFVGWTGDCASFGTTPTCTLTINGHKTATANFALVHDVVWTNASGVSVSANALLKTGAIGWNAGASSTYAIADGSGYTEITIPTGPGDAMFGLSNGDDNLGYADIDYAFYVYATGGRFIIYEKGVGTGRNGTYATGDKLRVAVNSGVVTYWQNGSLVYTSAATATYPLRVDTSLRTTGAKIEGAVLAGNLVSVAPPPPTPELVGWTNASGVSVSANALLKTGAIGWNAGASSTRAIANGSGYVEITVPTNPGDAMFGLSNGDSNLGYADIDYAFYVYATGGRFIIYEKGVGTGRNGTFAVGDKLRVAVENGVVTYWQNGALVYTSAATATYPLSVDTSLRTTGAKIEGAVLAGNLVNVVVWTNASGVSVSANALLKTGAIGWNAGASSTYAIADGSGYVEITIPTGPGDAMFGLSNGDDNLGYADIDYAFYVYATGGTFIIYEKGVGTGRHGTFAVGDRLRVTVNSGVVTYWQNGSLVYTSAATATYPLRVDTSLRTTGAKIEGAVLVGNLVNVAPPPPTPEPVEWTNASGVSVSANNLLKTGAVGWNAGASSTRAIANGSGYAEITVPTGPGDAMFGLSNGDSNLGYADIDYAFYVYQTSGIFIIYEKGLGTGRNGTYATGDKLRVAVNSGVVTYWQNGALVYTSAATATYPLRVDTSLRTTGAKIEGAVLAGTLE